MVRELEKKETLLRYHRNEIFKEIVEIGLNPREFDWGEDASGMGMYFVPTLIHVQTGYFFKFDISNDGRRVSYYYPTLEAEKELLFPGDWEKQKVNFLEWLNILKIELSSPDFWEAYLNASKMFEPTADSDLVNELFTTEEQTYISTKLLEIEKYLSEKQNLSAENIAFIKEKIGYLEECSKRLGKKDWLNIVIGISFKIAVDLGLSSEIAKEFFKLVGTAFGHFLSGPVFLP
ncbi:MAG: hypothetical protein AB1491_11135 [Thermodesulfobacteriota bacterium]